MTIDELVGIFFEMDEILKERGEYDLNERYHELYTLLATTAGVSGVRRFANVKFKQHLRTDTVLYFRDWLAKSGHPGTTTLVDATRIYAESCPVRHH